MKPIILAGGIIALAAGIGMAALYLRPGPPQAHPVPGDTASLTAAELGEQAFRVAPGMIETVYRAFALSDETEIYDTLAGVAAGDALETLYLERRGAMGDGGLDLSQQTIHEMQLLRLSSVQQDDALNWQARWRVVGTVGHATHMHARGNTYAATLTVAPVDGAWRITDFTLTDVDRSDAGTLVAAEQ